MAAPSGLAQLWVRKAQLTQAFERKEGDAEIAISG
jgi:hypothetical protein